MRWRNGRSFGRLIQVLLLMECSARLRAAAASRTLKVQQNQNHHRDHLHQHSLQLHEHDIVMRDDSMYIHIPKTGGTAMEEQYRRLGQIPARDRLYKWREGLNMSVPSWTYMHQCEGAGAVFHFTPEQMSRCRVEHNPYAGKAVFCTFRDPVDRLLSEFRWRAQECTKSSAEESTCRHMDNDLNNVTHMRADWDLHRFVSPEDFDGHELEFAAAVAKFLEGFRRRDVGTPVQKINGGMLHLQPQAWYIFDSKGRQTCDKIMQYEDWDYGYRARSTSSGQIIKSQEQHTSSTELRAKIRALVAGVYSADFMIQDELERLKSETHNEIRHWTRQMIVRNESKAGGANRLSQ